MSICPLTACRKALGRSPRGSCVRRFSRRAGHWVYVDGTVEELEDPTGGDVPGEGGDPAQDVNGGAGPRG